MLNVNIYYFVISSVDDFLVPLTVKKKQFYLFNHCIRFSGMMAGAYIWGSLADALGRRKVLIVISFMNALCIVLSTFAQSYGVFMFFRFLNGAA